MMTDLEQNELRNSAQLILNQAVGHHDLEINFSDSGIQINWMGLQLMTDANRLQKVISAINVLLNHEVDQV